MNATNELQELKRQDVDNTIIQESINKAIEELNKIKIQKLKN